MENEIKAVYGYNKLCVLFCHWSTATIIMAFKCTQYFNQVLFQFACAHCAVSHYQDNDLS